MVLRTRIISVIAIILLLTVGISTVLALRLQSQRMVSSALKDAEVLGNVILQSLETSMSTGDTANVQQVLENIGKSPEIENLRVISTAGYVLKSSRSEEIGKMSTDFSAMSPVVDDKPSSHVLSDSVTYMLPVRNKKQCFGCHSAGIDTIGIVEVKYDLSRHMADIMAVKRFLIVSNIFTVLFVTLILARMFGRMVIKPLQSMHKAIRNVESGELSTRLQVSNDDEIGRVGRAFNVMLDELQSLHDRSLRKEKEISRVKFELEHKLILEELNSQLQYKVKEVESANKAVLSLSKEVKAKNTELEKMVDRLKSVNDVGRVLTSIIETDELLKLIVRTTAETLGVQQGSIYVTRSDGSSLSMRYQQGVGVERETGEHLELSPLYQDLVEDGAPILMNSDSMPGEDGTAAASAIGVPLKMKGQVIGGILLEEKLSGNPFTQDELELLATMSNQAMVAIENAWLYETVKNNYFGTIQALVNALEASDRYTKGHSERVRFMGMELAKYIGLDYRELEAFEHAAILHDIGKIGIDTAVLNKQEELTSKEFSLIRAHPIIGDEILGPIGTLQGVRTTILQHHEKYDGTGYPYGIAGDEITLKARILSVVDTFDAMMTDRPYRRGMDTDYVYEELRRGAGTQFDPAVVNAFLEMLEGRPSLLEEAGYNGFAMN